MNRQLDVFVNTLRTSRVLRPYLIDVQHRQRGSMVRHHLQVAGIINCTGASLDPLSSQGILKALRSGKIASFVALDALDGRDSSSRYEALVASEYEDYCNTKRRFYSQEQRWPRSTFWQRRR